ncbi:MAG: hypothetical protein FWK04_06755 [Nostoc sp. GBBB01]|nr:hypothetical protein [Nostoc sp. GBBB01]
MGDGDKGDKGDKVAIFLPCLSHLPISPSPHLPAILSPCFLLNLPFGFSSNRIKNEAPVKPSTIKS